MANKRILLVEDESVSVLFIRTILEELDYEVCGIAAFGKQAVIKAQEEEPDLVLMDITLKGDMDGIETARHILEKRDIPIIFISAHSDTDTFERAKDTNPAAYMIKPFSREELQISLEIAFRNAGMSREIRRANSELYQLYNAINSILIGVSTKDTVTYFNRVAEMTFEIHDKALLGKQFTEIPIKWEATRIFEAISTSMIDQRPVRLEDVKFTRADGKERYLGLVINPMTNEAQVIQGFLIFGSDITERKNLELQLAQSHKLESIGQLAAGIAHEINTPMQYISDNTLFIKNSFSAIEGIIRLAMEFAANQKECDTIRAAVDESLKKNNLEFLYREIPVALNQTIEGIERVTKIVRSMKQFAHPSSDEKKYQNINQSLENTVIISKNEWKYCADLKLELDPDLPELKCYPDELNQVFLNLIVNAAQAIAELPWTMERALGTITVSSKTEDGNIIISISDTGGGIPPAVREKIFDPFFTTKEPGKGTGQGLAIAHSIITRKHGGSLTFTTEVGKGTTFIITLPIEQDETE